MTKVRAWLNAARLRTLPLSVSGILVGAGLAASQGVSNTVILLLALVTTVGLQITSNFANDYGDGIKGTDNDDRVGPKRALQSGILTAKQLKRGIYSSIIINFLLIVVLVVTSFGIKHIVYPAIFLVLGVFAIWAAIKYTVGKSAYGYNGLGDVFVFIFFGLVSVLGSLFLFLKTIPINSILPAISIGLLSVGVLNLNNMRDVKSDSSVGKNTLVVKIGLRNAKIYHYFLLIISFLCLFLFLFTTKGLSLRYVCLIGFVPVFIHMNKVRVTSNEVELDPELKKLALSTFCTALLFFITYFYFL
ncbi:1,4-dihydroxy-2-naphthoate octaprenyltransferase [Maribacter hydrothermalis]|uniref:1,4-dihydroxy-2-naphthoate octaprenyltransferase n=1 Tax=Maribacter hydrothermalis TaxID=1836467 RepID=A0A1B7ZCQ1_9FLAO|nr:1,4-dihydroxy-2-naphthoate octaprenyltransferase [Maribacter hydrothermalis]APQ18542.1 1,4-dihydroxy-2-naphthoate octaprenyltransferase [Maribacter hydrothermalis]OBR40903.1 1,4-dihydroxy-2-naphthoate octaprenyltransferase [Maribacter hydrothermalis]